MLMIGIILQRIVKGMQSKYSKAIPLVTFSNQTGYNLHPEAIEFLQLLPNEDEYAIVAAVGKSKSGKSYLLNQLLQDDSMFPVSSHLGNCTKGIHLATKYLQVGSIKAILLDVEGFGSTEGNFDLDCKLFIFSLLVSTVTLYNSFGAIDEQALNNLSMIIEVSKTFEKQIDLKQSIPALLWVLKDFSLKLEDKNGFPISASEYLQAALQEQKGSSQSINQKNRIRRVIKTMFCDRTCQTLVLPNSSLPQDQLVQDGKRPQFARDIEKLRSKIEEILIRRGPKKIFGQKMSIAAFIQSMTAYVNYFNKSLKEGTVVKFQSLTYQLREIQMQTQLLKLKQFLQQNREQFLQEILSQNDKFQTEGKLVNLIDEFYSTAESNLIRIARDPLKKELQLIKDQFTRDLQDQYKRSIEKQRLLNQQQLMGESEESGFKISNICEFFSHIVDQNELDSEYSCQIHKMKEKGEKIQPLLFANYLMKLEIAYLRRKVELRKEVTLSAEKAFIQLKYAQEQIQRLQQRNRELENGSAFNSFKAFTTPNKNSDNQYDRENISIGKSRMRSSSKEPGYIRTVNHSTKKTAEKQGWKFESNPKVQSSSFYVPYVLIEKGKYLSAKIIRTLIKEDSKRNSYIQYVIQVHLQSQTWSIHRKFKDFSQLHGILVMMFRDQNLPTCQSIVGKLKSIDFNATNRNEFVQLRRKELEEYLEDLISIDILRNSRIFQKFLKINKEFTLS